ncbi:MAG: TetR/AcrR family transcriptional regulator [Lachnospiraceae bacterium]|nr:TetR/AcrR family transcriptional regulator [Lachnospiraceae bacterium]
MARETRKVITDALLDLALENPSRTNFSMTEIAERAGVSRQAIYQKHFRNYGEIVRCLREMTNEDVYTTFQKYNCISGEDPFQFFADKILPIFYKKQKLLRCFFTTALDPTWRNYIIDLYSKWEIDIYQRKHTEFHLSNCAMTRMFIGSTISIVEAWICQDEPVSAEIFRTDFLRLVSTPLSNLLVVN